MASTTRLASSLRNSMDADSTLRHSADADASLALDRPLLDPEASINAPEAASDDAKVPEGTFASSVFMVFNSAVGTGILTLPYAFLAAGLYGGALCLAFYVIVELGAVRAILECTAASRSSSYPQVVRHYLGDRAGAVFAGVIATYCFFAATAAFIIVVNVASPTLALVYGDGAAPAWASKYAQVGAAGVVVFPLLLLKNITSLRFTAMLSFAAILYVVAVVVAQFFERPGAADAGPLDAWGAWPSLVLAVPNVMLSLQAHIQIPSIYADMRPSLRSVNAMTAAAAAAYALIAALYGIIAVFGLLTFRRDTQPNIMECDYRAGDPSIVAARACLALTAVFSIPVNHHPARDAVWAMVSGGSKAPMPRTFFYGETAVFFLGALGLACAISELSTLNDLMGLTAGVAVIFLMPGLFLWSRSRGGKGDAAAPETQGQGAAALYVAVAAASFCLCVYSFVGSEYLRVATRAAPE